MNMCKLMVHFQTDIQWALYNVIYVIFVTGFFIIMYDIEVLE
jgi:hypothetical protein